MESTFLNIIFSFRNLKSLNVTLKAKQKQTNKQTNKQVKQETKKNQPNKLKQQQKQTSRECSVRIPFQGHELTGASQRKYHKESMTPFS